MKYATISVAAYSSCVLLAGCVTQAPLAQTAPRPQIVTSRASVPPGTEVPFAKVMDAAFARQYVKSDIVTTAVFVATGMGNYVLPNYSADGKVMIRCQSTANSGQRNPLSGELECHFVALPKGLADSVFTLTPGSMVELRGGTWVANMGGLLAKGMAGMTIVVFEATSIDVASTK